MNGDFEKLTRLATPFMHWAVQLGLYEPVVQAFDTVLVALEQGGSLDDLVLARDAVLSLVGLAYSGGFVELGGWFYREYEQFCALIASAME